MEPIRNWRIHFPAWARGYQKKELESEQAFRAKLSRVSDPLGATTAAAVNGTPPAKPAAPVPSRQQITDWLADHENAGMRAKAGEWTTWDTLPPYAREEFLEHLHALRAGIDPGDFLRFFLIRRRGSSAAVGRERERFEREIKRARYCGSFVIIVEGTFGDVLNANHARGQLTEAAIAGTVAAWTRRGAPVIFAGTAAAAADLAFRFLAGQVREMERTARVLTLISGPDVLP